MAHSQPYGFPLCARRWHASSRIVAGVLALAAVGCASTPAAFSARYPDNVQSDLAVLLRRVQEAPPRSDGAIGAGVTTEPKKLYGYDVGTRRVLWQTPANVRFTPLLAGDVVVTQEGSTVVLRDLKTGRTRLSFDAHDMTLNGADGDDVNVAVVLTAGMGTYAKSRVVLVKGGAVAWERRLESTAGSPAVIDGMVLVPWSNQYLSALSMAEGDEFARLRVRDAVLGHALVNAGKVFAGSQHGIGQLTDTMMSGNLQNGPYLAAPKQPLPGRPLFLRDVYTQMPAPESAQNRIRLSWLPTGSSPHAVALAGGNLYLAFYRFVFAVDPKDLALHWVYAHEADLVGARAQADGLVIADVNGEVRYLAASSGKTVWFEKNGLPSVDLELPSAGAGSGVTADNAVPDAVAVRQQLVAAAQDADARMVPMRLLAVELLAKLDDAEATSNLLGLCEDERTTAPVRKAACLALKERKTGGDYLLTALQRHSAYLEGTLPPPVGALAKAAAAQHEKRAVPLLIAHLTDPSTPAETLPPLVTALADLGDAGAARPLADFMRLYHADPIDEHLGQALSLVPDALVKLIGPAARETLTQIVNDPLGTGTVRDRARRALAQLDDQAKAAEKNDEATKLAEEQEAQKQQAGTTGKQLLPTHITLDVVKQTLTPVREKLQACVQSAKPDAFQARVVLVIEDGQVLMVSVLPEQLQSCIEPLIRSQHFPMTQVSKRERLSYTIKRY
ncbi:MAG TPA: hypothetical protein VF331_18830 [Polyangiales bacterium]